MNFNSEIIDVYKDIENDILIKGRKWGVSNPRAIICLVHGIGEHSGRYEELAVLMNKANISMYAIDLRGHGNSSGCRGFTSPRAEVLEDIKSMVQIAREENKNKPIFMMGQSMGGNIVLDYRNRRDFSEHIKGYIVMSSWLKLYKKIGKLQYTAIKLLSKLKPKYKLSLKIDTSQLGNSKNYKNYEKDELIHGYIATKTAVEAFDIGLLLMKDKAVKSGIGRDKPMLLMHGDKDRICHYKGSEILGSIQEHCEFILWNDGLHELHNSQQGMKNKIVDKILKFIDENS